MSEKNFIGYEYKDISTKLEKENLFMQTGMKISDGVWTAHLPLQKESELLV